MPKSPNTDHTSKFYAQIS